MGALAVASAPIEFSLWSGASARGDHCGDYHRSIAARRSEAERRPTGGQNFNLLHRNRLNGLQVPMI
jgi:hypothetical protein